MNILMNNARAIEVKNISHFFVEEEKSIHALEGISFAVKKGEFFTILGPSGCGKSTLLRIVAEMVKPTRGEVNFSEESENKALSMIFQSFAIFPWLTVFENVGFGLSMRGISDHERLAIVKEHIKEIGLMGFEHVYPKDLSGGMKQRVGIARALAMNPKILLMDEAFSSLDSFIAAKLRAEVLDLWLKDKMTIIAVTHLVNEAVEMSDRILVMTPIPGKVEAILDINLPRPRDQRSPEFFKLVDRLNEIVKI